MHPPEHAQPEFKVEIEEFAETCLAFYEVIKIGSRKARKRAAQDLVIMAITAYEELQSERAATDMNDAILRGAMKSDPNIATAHGGTCVINEHAHGDEHL